MSRIFSLFRAAAFSLLFACVCIATKSSKWMAVKRTFARAALSSILIGSQITTAVPVLAVDTTFQQQLKVIQALQVEQQKIVVQKAMNKGMVDSAGRL